MLNRDPQFMGQLPVPILWHEVFVSLINCLLTGLLVIVNFLSLVSLNIYLVA